MVTTVRSIFVWVFFAYLAVVALSAMTFSSDKDPGTGLDGIVALLLALPWSLVNGLDEGGFARYWSAILLNLFILGLLAGPWLYGVERTQPPRTATRDERAD